MSEPPPAYKEIPGEDLVAELEEKASALSVTVDYYISEFTNLTIKK